MIIFIKVKKYLLGENELILIIGLFILVTSQCRFKFMEHHHKEKSLQICLCSEAHVYCKGLSLWHQSEFLRSGLC